MSAPALAQQPASTPATWAEVPTLGYARHAEARLDDQGVLWFSPPAGAYASIPTWGSRAQWLTALAMHPRLHGVCRHFEIAVDTFLNVMQEYAAHGDDATGRNIAVSNEVIAAAIGVSGRHVRNATSAARELGMLRVVLAGSPMSLTQRSTVLDRYGKGLPQRRWRNLPNYLAATIPAEIGRHLAQRRARLAKAAIATQRAHRAWRTPGARLLQLVAPVDNPVRSMAAARTFFHPPRGPQPGWNPHLPLYELPLFRPDCGQTPNQRAEEQRRTAATRPTNKRPHKNVRRTTDLDPALRAFAKAFTARLPAPRRDPYVWNRVQPRRVAQALNRHRLAGLSPGEVVAGMGTYLRTQDRGWDVDWRPDEHVDQARYLVAVLTAAAAADQITPDPS